MISASNWLLGAAVILAGCQVGSVEPLGDGDGDGQWTPITDPSAGAIEGDSFELDPAGTIVAIVDNKICQWDADAGAWSPLAEPPPDTTIEHIRLRNGALFAMLATPAGRQICQYVSGAWEPRTLVGPNYAGGFSIAGPLNRITAVIDEATGRRLCECNLTTCTPMTPIAAISASDFDCDGCDAFGPTYFAQLGTKVCSAAAGAAQWNPETIDAPAALGPSVIAASGEIYVEIADHVCQYDTAAQTFIELTAEFPDLIDFKQGTGPYADSWLGLADGVVCNYH